MNSIEKVHWEGILATDKSSLAVRKDTAILQSSPVMPVKVLLPFDLKPIKSNAPSLGPQFRENELNHEQMLEQMPQPKIKWVLFFFARVSIKAYFSIIIMYYACNMYISFTEFKTTQLKDILGGVPDELH